MLNNLYLLQTIRKGNRSAHQYVFVQDRDYLAG